MARSIETVVKNIEKYLEGRTDGADRAVVDSAIMPDGSRAYLWLKDLRQLVNEFLECDTCAKSPVVATVMFSDGETFKVCEGCAASAFPRIKSD